jgi:putative Mg2+ transporter-C (MgtC) family protein
MLGHLIPRLKTLKFYNTTKPRFIYNFSLFFHMDVLPTLLRFLLTFVFAFFFGLERQRAHKPVSFGTYIFVSLGSCALAITSVNLSPANPLSLLGSIVTGIGFLGAGALIKTTDKIFGFTSAASIWLFAILGLVIGVGEYFIGIIMYIAVWVVIFVDYKLEERGIGTYQKRMIITTNSIVEEKKIKEILLLELRKHKLISVEVDKKNNKLVFSYLIEGTKDKMNLIPRILFKESWFESCKIE